MSAPMPFATSFRREQARGVAARSSLAGARSWYEASAPALAPAPPLRGTVEADVVVVGAGYTGLSAALDLRARGYSVAVLEAGRIGGGASGRNGGQIVTAYNPSMARIEGLVGREDARRLWAMGEESKAIIRERVERHAIDCDLHWGYIFAALKDRQVGALDAMQREWQAYGYDGLQRLDRGEIRSWIETDKYAGGLFDPGGGHLHPLKYVQGLARAAREAGVALYEDSPVVRIETETKPVATTAEGAVRARHMILAGNALFRLVPSMAWRIMPVTTFMIGTAPLAPERADALVRGRHAVADINFVLNYYRVSADHRMLFGGGVSYSGFDGPGLRARLRRTMLRFFPHLADAPIEFCWGGWVDISLNRLPHFGRLGPSTYFAQGFSGHGVALTGLAGRLMAEAVATTAERFDVFARLPHHPFPGGPLRTPALVAATAWYRLRDLL
ncbi:MAG TPA: FAD-binding oxidoreductase [Alphaproteobacteria bacterium]|nr:FAD-binding oxidoreductase [Alphaproteobacteria bacterium]